MNSREAKVVLSSLRPGDALTREPLSTEALALADADPELKSWWQSWNEFDRLLSAKLADVPVPEELRGAILASRKITPLPPRMSYSLWLAAAALVALLAVAVTFWHVANFGPLDRGDFADRVLPLLHHDSPALAMTSSDRTQLMSWLKSRGAPVGLVPQKVANLNALGCQRYIINGHTVSLLCFTQADGGIYHLFMVDRDALSDPPTLHPEINSVKGWNVAVWSDEKMSYLLATQADPEALKKLL